MNDNLPDFPRPDLPESAPENYPTLRIRIFRRLGLPDDGGLWINDAITPEILRGYNGILEHDDVDGAIIAFASLQDAASWADGVTAVGSDRSLLSFVDAPTLFGPAKVKVSFLK